MNTCLFINLMSNYCREQKQHDPVNFPSGRKIHYQPKTSTYSLCGHIEHLHLVEFLRLAQTDKWMVYLTKVKVALKLGYNLSTLLEALKLPGVTIHNLPPPPQCPSNTQENLQPGGELWDNKLPSFSTAAFHQFLVRFITADDQVHTS